MKRAIILILILLLFGCVSEKEIAPIKKETLLTSEEIDLDDDGSWDYATYTFAPVQLTESGLTVQRHLFVSIENSIIFSSFNKLTDYDAMIAANQFEEFVHEKELFTRKCENSVGLIGVTCGDINTCSKLCSVASTKCRKINEENNDVLGYSMLSFVKDNREIHNIIYEARAQFATLQNSTEAQMFKLADTLNKAMWHIASISANPLFTHPALGLCTHDGLGANRIKSILNTLGNYTKEPTRYHYTMVFTITTASKTATGLGSNTIVLRDSIPKLDVHEEAVKSPQVVYITSGATNMTFNWQYFNPYKKEKSLLLVEFSSSKPPSEFLSMLAVPHFVMKTLDITIMVPTIVLFDIIVSMIGNHQFALGIALSVTLILLLITYTILVIAYQVLRARAAGEKASAGIRRAIAKTRLRWKGDLMLAVVLLVVGFLASFYFAKPIGKKMDMFEAVEYILQLENYLSLIGVFCIFLGFSLLYLAAENKVKISFLEKEYGREIKHEHDLFTSNIAQLKLRLSELKKLADELAAEGIDVSKEYAIIESYPQKSIDALAEKMDAYSKRMVEHHLIEVESAFQSLSERRKMITENWQGWSEVISRAFEERGEVTAASLTTIPPSLRTWALRRYLKEHPGTGLVYEEETLRQKRIPPERIAAGIVANGLATGAVLMKGEKLLFAHIEGGSRSVAGVLSLKLLSYAKGVVKHLGMHSFTSFAIVGNNTVLALIKMHDYNSLLFIRKEKFKEAVEEWKNKLKLLEK